MTGTDGRLRIVYVAGWGRSGSTLLAALVGGVTPMCNVGEARSFWDRGLVQGWPCACGAALGECEVWGPATVAAPTWPMAPAEVATFQREHLRTRRYATAWRDARRGSLPADARRYAATYSQLHECLSATTGAKVIFDSSKYPLDAYLLAALADVDVRVVHLVRDPRAVAHSWTTTKVVAPGHRVGSLRRFRPASSSLIWTTWNLMVERLLRDLPVLTVRYEDLAAEPNEQIGAVAAFAGVPLERPVEGGSLALGRNHMVAGNPLRFGTGDVAIVEDVRWKTAMTAPARIEAVLPALPLMRHYGYRIQP